MLEKIKEENLGDQVAGNSNTEAKEIQESVSQHLNDPNLHIAINKHNNMNTLNNISDLTSLRQSIITSTPNNESKNSEKETHIVTIDNFFIENDPMNGIALMDEFIKMLNEINDTGFNGLCHFFHYAFQGKRFSLSGKLKDKMNNPYYWGRVYEGLSETGFKIPYFEGLDKLIKNTEVKIQVSVQLEEILNLIKSTKKSSAA